MDSILGASRDPQVLRDKLNAATPCFQIWLRQTVCAAYGLLSLLHKVTHYEYIFTLEKVISKHYILTSFKWLEKILLIAMDPIKKHTFTILSSFSSVWLFATLWAVAHQASLSMGFSRQEPWNGLPFPLPGESSPSRDWTGISYVSCIGRCTLTPLTPPGKPIFSKLGA